MNNRFRDNQKKSKVKIVTSIVIISLIAGLSLGIWISISGNFNEQVSEPTPNMEQVGFLSFNGLTNSRLYILLEDELLQIDTPHLLIEGEVYLPADFLRQHIDRHVFWEENVSRLTISNMDEVLRFSPDSNVFTNNWQEFPLEYPIRQMGQMAFMNTRLIQDMYPVNINFSDEYNLVIIDFTYNQQLIYVATSTSLSSEDGEEPPLDLLALRVGPSNQHPLFGFLEEGQNMVYLGSEGDYMRVRLDNGVIGYIYAEHTEFVDIIVAIPHYIPRRPLTRTFNRPQNFLWHQVTNPTAAANSAAWYRPLGVDIMSPTWWTFDAAALNGDIVDIGNHEYIAWAHSHGMEVWPKITDNFDSGISYAVLSDAYVRDHVVAQLIHFIEYYGISGINVDYEAVQPHFAEQWIQFLRELSVPMRQMGAVLSVAVFVPEPWNLFWNHYEIGHTADFLLIMAYDEHYGTSAVAGPVASFDFVYRNTIRTLEMVPPQQVMLGLPYFVRIWREVPQGEGQPPLVNQMMASGMAYARSHFEARGAEFVWDYFIRKYYAEYFQVENGVEVRYRVWLEDLRSIEEKLNIFSQYGLAGVAGWRKGLELPEVWPLIYSFTRGE